MKNRFSVTLLLVLFVVRFSYAQYFQQQVNYKIQVSLDDVKHELEAFESILYTNNAPDELSEIYFHLWPNAYKDNTTALCKQLMEEGNASLYFAPDSLRGFIDQLAFSVNDRPVKLIYDSLNIDICKIILNQPLKSGDSILITTPFHVKIPSAKFSRLGHTGQAYYITQWYPKPAVYDQLGWHAMPYLNQGEFYSEFGSYDVSLTLPANYVAGATGDLQDEGEKQWLDEKANNTKQIKIFSKSLSFPASSAQTKTITWKQTNVHDFAWMADKRFNVLKSEIELPNTKHKVNTWVLFTNAQAGWWSNATTYIDSALYYYSLWNGDYPYNNCTAVDGTIIAGGGMEYPNITVINSVISSFELEDFIAHEVGHNWFYGILGSNERDHAWMDEGINSFNEMRYVQTRFPGSNSNGKNDFARLGFAGKLIGGSSMNFKETFDLEYLSFARIHLDQPVDLKSVDFTSLNYGVMVYRKTALLFDYLKAYLGEPVFDECMKTYFNEWKYKHPYPQDVKNIFEKRTGKNLNWFFDELIFTSKKIDYRMDDVKIKNDSLLAVVENRGEVSSPVLLSGLKNGNVVTEKWFDGHEGKKELTLSCNDCDYVKIDAADFIPDLNRKNNTMRAIGIFRKTEPLQFSFFGKPENPNRTQLFYTPVPGWNNYNKTMMGVAIYNKFVPNKKFEYVLMPMYSFGTENIAGNVSMSYTFYPQSKRFQSVAVDLAAKHYTYDRDKINYYSDATNSNFNFTALPIDVTFRFKKAVARSVIDKTIQLRSINTWQDQLSYDGASVSKQNRFLSYAQIIFNYNNGRTLDPYSFNAVLENGNKFMKANVQFNYKFSYPNIYKGVDVRFFAGAFIYNNELERNINYRMSAFAGYDDYLYDNIYLGRNEASGIFSRQMYVHEGGFKINSPVGQSNKWLAALNVLVDGPGRLPLCFFLDAGSYNSAGKAFEGSQTIMYDGGICVSLIKNTAEVYVPLFISSDIKSALDANDIKFKERIRFVLNINIMNPFRLRNQLLRY